MRSQSKRTSRSPRPSRNTQDSPGIARSREIMATALAALQTMRAEIAQVAKQLQREHRAELAAGGGLPNPGDNGRRYTAAYWAADSLRDLIQSEIKPFAKILNQYRTENWQETIEEWIASQVKEARQLDAAKTARLAKYRADWESGRALLPRPVETVERELAERITTVYEALKLPDSGSRELRRMGEKTLLAAALVLAARMNQAAPAAAAAVEAA